MLDISARTSLVLGIAAFILAVLGLFTGLISLFGIVGALAAIFALVSGVNALDVIKPEDKVNRTLAKIALASAGLGLLIFVIALGLSTWNYYKTLSLP